MKYIQKHIILILALLPAILSAQENKVSSDKVYTIESCYSMVRENYPLVKMYNLIDITRDYSLKNAYMHYFPQISIKGSASYQSDVLEFPFDIPTIEIPTFSKDQYTALIELSQVLWDGGMIAAERENIRAKAEVEKEQQEVDMYTLRNRVNDLYFGILLMKEQLSQCHTAIRELDSQLDRIKTCIANGVANNSDMDLLEVEKISKLQNKENIESLLSSYLRMLSLMTGTQINNPEMLVEPIPESVNKEEMLAELILGDIRRPELKVFDARLKEIETQLDYWTANGLPQLRLFIRGGYGRPGLNMMDNNPNFYAIGGIQLIWNISELYSLGYGKKIVQHSKSKIHTMKDTFIFNTNLQAEQQSAEVRKIMKNIENDRQIVALRQKIRISTEKELENGTKNASDLLTEINKEDLAVRQLTLHEIELMKSLYELKMIKNN